MLFEEVPTCRVQVQKPEPHGLGGALLGLGMAYPLTHAVIGCFLKPIVHLGEEEAANVKSKNRRLGASAGCW